MSETKPPQVRAVKRRDTFFTVVIVGAALVGIFGYFGWHRSSVPVSAARTNVGARADFASAAELHALERRVLELSKQVAALTRALEQSSAARSVPQSAPAPETESEPALVQDDVEPSADERPAQRAARLEQARFAHLADHLMAEPRDGGWASRVERNIGGALDPFRQSVAVQEVTCRQTLCRVVVAPADQAAREQFGTFFTTLVRQELPNATTRLQDDKVELYLARAGHELPSN